MARRKQRERYVEPDDAALWQVALILSPLFTLPVLAALVWVFELLPWAWIGPSVAGSLALAAVGFAGFLLKRPGRRTAVDLDDRGLTERLWLKRPRRHMWDRVRDVVIGSEGFTVVTADGEVPVQGSMPNWRRLARQIQAYLGTEAEPTADEVVESQQMAEWLGIEPDGALVVRTRRRSTLPWWLGGLLFAGSLVNLFSSELEVSLLLFAEWMVGLLGVALLNIHYRADGATIRATTDGLFVKVGDVWRHHDWDDLRAVEQDGAEWVIRTDAGDVRLHRLDDNAERLVAAVEQALDARRLGQALPRMGAVPDGAISPVRLDGNVVQRGLSRSEAY